MDFKRNVYLVQFVTINVDSCFVFTNAYLILLQWGYGQTAAQQPATTTDATQQSQAYNAAWGAYNQGQWANWNQQYQQWYGQAAAAQYGQQPSGTSGSTTQ